MNTVVGSHLAYLALTVSVTIWVGRTLRKQGTAYITTGNDGRRELASSMSQLLVVGFYLLNLGIVAIALRFGDRATDLQSAIEILSNKAGYVLLGQGLVYFIIVGVISSTRTRFDDAARQDEWIRTSSSSSREALEFTP